MSGICGWFGADPAPDSGFILERMAEALPQFGEIKSSSAHGPTFGLAIRAVGSTGSFAIDSNVFAAIEGYPAWSDEALKRLATEKGHANALIAAYRDNGSTLLNVLRGSFSFAIIDAAAGTLLLAIDRMGIQTLCYAEPRPGAVVFGSTTDAVRTYPGLTSTIALQSLFNYIYFVDRVPAPDTIYREQRKLIPGEYLFLDARRTEVKRYWRMPYRSEASLDATAAAHELRARLRRAVERNLTGEDALRVGAFLSGGLDSSSVVGFASELLAGGLQTFTIGFPVEGFDETRYAQIAATRFKTDHHVYKIRANDVIEAIENSVRIYDEPFANSSIVPTYYCARLATQTGVAMMLAGDGGDELFAGNERYAKDRVFDHYAALPPSLRTALIEPAARALSFTKQFGPFGKAVRYVELASRSVPDRMTGNLFLTAKETEIFAPEILRNVSLASTHALIAAIYDDPAHASKVQRMMHFDLRITLADSDLRKVSRMCELAGVRVRYPFLEHDLVEFTAGLPEGLLMAGGRLRQFYKIAMKGFLPDEILNKRKHGFGLPYLNFMNSHLPLRNLICDGVSDLRKRNFFRTDFLDTLLDHTRRGEISTKDSFVWDLLVLELWFQSRNLH